MRERELRLDVEDRHPVAVLRLGGFFAQLEIYKLKSQADMLLNEAIRYLIVDLSDVMFIDSAGLGALTQLRLDCSKLGGALSLVKPNVPQVKLALETALLQRIVDIYPDVKTALDQMHKKYNVNFESGAPLPDREDLLAQLAEQVAQLQSRLAVLEERLNLLEKPQS